MKNSENPYFLSLGEAPVVISVPHCGTEFPDDLKHQFVEKFVAFPEDTDWFVDQVYSFAPQLDITFIRAKYSRYVIDLNRNPEGLSLYQDQRVQTELLPSQSFALEKIYRDEKSPDENEKMSRIDKYFNPYYEAIHQQLSRLQKKHKNVLLFDGHSIKRSVPSVNNKPFPDLILGTRDGSTCDHTLLQNAEHFLSSSGYQYSVDSPFKGGNITRSFAQPSLGIHTMQLEMSQDTYMDEIKTVLTPDRFDNLQTTLSGLIEVLLTTLRDLNEN